MKSATELTQYIIRHRMAHLPLAALAVGLYFLALHPASGAIGGFIYFFYADILASTATALVALWIAGFLTKRWARNIAFALLWPLVCLGLKLPDFVRAIMGPPPAAVMIDRPTTFAPKKVYPLVLISPGTELNKSYGDPFLKDNILQDDIEVSGDEGCGCYYFAIPRNSYGEMVTYALDDHAIAAWTEGTPEAVPYFRLVVHKDAAGTFATARLEIIDDKGVAASIEQASIPLARVIHLDGYRLNRPHFWSYAWMDFQASNIWRIVANHNVPKTLDREKLEAFLKAATLPPPP